MELKHHKTLWNHKCSFFFTAEISISLVWKLAEFQLQPTFGKVNLIGMVKEGFNLRQLLLQKSPLFSLLSPTSPCQTFEREVLSPL